MNRHDLVYRDDIIDAIKKNIPHAIFDDYGNYTVRGMWLLDTISAVSPVQVERKKGKWIEIEPHMVICPFCKHASSRKNFCAECGADMRDNSDE